MALTIGQAATDPVSGLAGRIWTAASGNTALFPSGAPTGDDRAKLAVLFGAIATAVIDEIQANATVTIKTSDAGLQRDSTNAATQGPSADKTLAAGCIQ